MYDDIGMRKCTATSTGFRAAGESSGLASGALAQESGDRPGALIVAFTAGGAVGTAAAAAAAAAAPTALAIFALGLALLAGAVLCFVLLALGLALCTGLGSLLLRLLLGLHGVLLCLGPFGLLLKLLLLLFGLFFLFLPLLPCFVLCLLLDDLGLLPGLVLLPLLHLLQLLSQLGTGPRVGSTSGRRLRAASSLAQRPLGTVRRRQLLLRRPQHGHGEPPVPHGKLRPQGTQRSIEVEAARGARAQDARRGRDLPVLHLHHPFSPCSQDISQPHLVVDADLRCGDHSARDGAADGEQCLCCSARQ
mmetsp:Transcript_83262/g.269356  ORF Transcript_83262/g.269356 Transcript_83262/m.269356 type:complete len:305 (+) Transcript_83262:253-1167(+)